METKSWKEIKDNVYGDKGTPRRDKLDREFETFKVGLMLKKAREEKHLTQEQLGRRKLRMLNNSQNLSDLRIPPSNRFEKLQGSDFYSIRINDQ